MRLIAALLLGACTSTPGTPGATELSVYTFADYLPDQVVRDYEAAAGVKVNVSTYETNEELLASLAARPTAYDVIVPSDYAVEILIKDHALRPLDLGKISNYNNIDPSFLSPYFDPGGLGGRGRAKKEKFSLPYLWGMTGIAYDRTKVNPAPTQWADLWRADLGGKLVVLDDAREMIGIGLLVNGKQKNTSDGAAIDAARDKLLALAPNVASFDANSGEKALLDGTAVAGVLFSGNAALAQRGNPNIEWVLPSDGPGIWFDNLAIPVGAPHPQAAEGFVDYLLSAEAGAKVSIGYPFSNPNVAAINWLRDHDKAAYDAYRESAATSPPTTSLAGALLVKDVGPEASKRYESAWDAVKAQKGTP